MDWLTAVYALATNPGEWLVVFAFGVFLVSMLLWALWLNLSPYWSRWRRRR